MGGGGVGSTAGHNNLAHRMDQTTVEPLDNRHHWDQRFVLCSFAQRVIVDRAPLTIVARYAGARLWFMKPVKISIAI